MPGELIVNLRKSEKEKKTSASYPTGIEPAPVSRPRTALINWTSAYVCREASRPLLSPQVVLRLYGTVPACLGRVAYEPALRAGRGRCLLDRLVRDEPKDDVTDTNADAENGDDGGVLDDEFVAP
jgi:hypothetical protein